ncbi:type I-E CRISPR-associated protein Cse2/CasB [Corynebacterium liangguodongii]|uniref:Type I-E CRISPR-associated protein Cse2/CasB n=1 Tax=Corynebacterium liangguodongii TaxID=2079535 RepID=A0A2S0WG98_9CORY|nr:type I-E CRISPR-associated protein Cse2/CasB [Corynebacterium liangguodongii]AWB84756.1 type I-E CRISPR-associated protein Cse2/CasB [Corynebacterium liangguodongii]PWB99113.1 type I-E CRISPR-associated protein Cse2/CasB [Corynebacterium liangguodongii]
MTAEPSHDVGQQLRFAVGHTATRLQEAYLGASGDREAASARGVLAGLRANGSRPLQENPLGLQETLLVLSPPAPEEPLRRGKEFSDSEYAAYTALSLFARHMQSAKAPVHTEERSFAQACGRLVALSDSASIKPRFDAMQLAATEEARATHLRSLVDLLKAHELAFDYGAFARDLRSLSSPKRKNSVLLRWGREFSRGLINATANGDTTESTSTSGTSDTTEKEN